jgi:hypothetical protein
MNIRNALSFVLFSVYVILSLIGRTIRKKDELKLDMMEDKGFTLITIPFWWDTESR